MAPNSLGLGIVTAPVTWLFGPVASLNVIDVASPLLSALAMFWLLRRWLSWAPAAFAGGLFFGFSPFILVSLALAHPNFGLLAPVPLIVGCLDDLFLRRRRRPGTVGIVLGLLLVVEFSISVEILLLVALFTAVAAVVVVVRDLVEASPPDSGGRAPGRPRGGRGRCGGSRPPRLPTVVLLRRSRPPGGPGLARLTLRNGGQHAGAVRHGLHQCTVDRHHASLRRVSGARAAPALLSGFRRGRRRGRRPGGLGPGPADPLLRPHGSRGGGPLPRSGVRFLDALATVHPPARAEQRRPGEHQRHRRHVRRRRVRLRRRPRPDGPSQPVRRRWARLRPCRRRRRGRAGPGPGRRRTVAQPPHDGAGGGGAAVVHPGRTAPGGGHGGAPLSGRPRWDPVLDGLAGGGGHELLDGGRWWPRHQPVTRRARGTGLHRPVPGLGTPGSGARPHRRRHHGRPPCPGRLGGDHRGRARPARHAQLRPGPLRRLRRRPVHRRPGRSLRTCSRARGCGATSPAALRRCRWRPPPSTTAPVGRVRSPADRRWPPACCGPDDPSFRPGRREPHPSYWPVCSTSCCPSASGGTSGAPVPRR